MSEQESGWGAVQIPEAGGSQFMKFNNGENKFRILSQPLSGYVAWTETPDGPRPIRFDHEPTQDELQLNNVRPDDKGRLKSKFFLAMVVYNHAQGLIQCLEVTQKTVYSQIYNLTQEPTFGNPTNYDIKVSKTGEGLGTEYSVMGMPPAPIAPEVDILHKNTPYDLKRLFSGEYPFIEI